ncbi:MAG TPA: 1-deoxy-D-xylulose-5-phosphate reductoisomerase [Candidatus Moranbacteria bacterium]|nr:1-deoxy-D-xylulose-5-phosphate reductoisomerase [Candidatus Moranbacteria bacterium]
MKKKKVAIFGSTGNVGKQILEVVDKYPDKFKAIALTAGSNADELKRQIKKYRPRIAALADPQKAAALGRSVKIPILSGQNINEEIARRKDYDVFVNSLVGLVGIKATLVAIRERKKIALANKETLVAAGEIIMREAFKYKTNIMPIDSEHSALFQCLNGEKREDIYQLIITCSGGALRDKTKEELKSVTIEEALGHKTWAMGQKITIDSATLMNKGFEVIEAMWLYDIPVEKIKVVIHPESLIHSMIEFSDASVMAQIAEPDMKLPIQYALSYPERWEAPIKRWDFRRALTFQKPDLVRFPCLGLALKAAREKGTLPAAMNAANDYMVAQFLQGKCKYLDIPRVIRRVMREHKNIKKPTLESIDRAIIEATNKAEKILYNKK